MPTKYIDVQGCATFLHYAGATTLPDVIPDFSRGRKILLTEPPMNPLKNREQMCEVMFHQRDHTLLDLIWGIDSRQKSFRERPALLLVAG